MKKKFKYNEMSEERCVKCNTRLKRNLVESGEKKSRGGWLCYRHHIELKQSHNHKKAGI